MSVEIINKIWFNEKLNVSTKLEFLLTALDKHEKISKEWNNLTVRDHTLANKILHKDGPFSLEEVTSILHSKNIESGYFSINTYMKCWRFRKSGPIYENVPISIKVWSEDYINYSQRSIEIEGDAMILVDDSGPFIALLNKDKKIVPNSANLRVEENLESLFRIIDELVRYEIVSSIKVFSSNGLYQPLNAHLIYFSDNLAIINDFKFINKLWNDGLPAYNTPPFSSYLNKVDSYSFHNWRDKKSQLNLVKKLTPLVNKAGIINNDSIDKISWNKFDFYETNPGIIILDYPYWMNSFLDHFYLEVLKHT